MHVSMWRDEHFLIPWGTYLGPRIVPNLPEPLFHSACPRHGMDVTHEAAATAPTGSSPSPWVKVAAEPPGS